MKAKSKRSSVIAAAAVSALAVCFGMTPRAASASEPTPAELLAQNFQAEHEIGRRFRIDPADLPAPKTGPIVTNRPLIVPITGRPCRCRRALSRRRSRPASSIRAGCSCCPMATCWSPSRAPAI